MIALIDSVCLHFLIECLFTLGRVLNIESDPNTNYAGVCCVVVCTIVRANLVDAKILSQGFSSSSIKSCTLNVRIILPILIWH